jgi:hypothetical protein
MRSLMAEEGMGLVLTLEGLINTTGDSVLTFKPLIPAHSWNVGCLEEVSGIFHSLCEVSGTHAGAI